MNNSGDPAHPSAILDITSTEKGLLIPRMTSDQRTQISNPALGLMVYDITTRSFWYCDGSWVEIGSGGNANGEASGDLTGYYPNPIVAKIQGHPLSAYTPNDKQVLKWDNNLYQWKGSNDSLFLPYNATTTHGSHAFAIHNTFSGLSYSTAIHGKRGDGSGIPLNQFAGIWGDANAGSGLLGTSLHGSGVSGKSVNAQGIYGQSEQHHGIEGVSLGGTGKAGILGRSLSPLGYGVIGETAESGIALYGKATGNNSVAGRFENTHPDGQQAALEIHNAGLGISSFLFGANVNNINPAMKITNMGQGHGLQVEKNGGGGAAIQSFHESNGYGLHAKSSTGIAGKFEITNPSNSNPALHVSNQGSGTSLFVNSTQTGLTGPAIDVFSLGTGAGLNVFSSTGKAAVLANGDNTTNNTVLDVTNIGMHHAAKFVTDNASNFEATVNVVNNGTGNAIESVITNTDNINAALYAVNHGQHGTLSYGKSTGVYGHATGTSNGVGVWGQAHPGDPNGIGVKGVAGGAISGGIGILGEGKVGNPNAIGVKGISHNPNSYAGAVTGINMSTGVGVYGEATGQYGYGIAGITGHTNQLSTAGLFRNYYNNNTQPVIWSISNGKGSGLFMENSNLTNSTAMLRMNYAGTGNFMTLENNLGNIKTTINKDGNITTDGTITVRENKGIVRNTTSTQLRMQVMTFAWDPQVVFEIGPGDGLITEEFFFDPPFTEIPCVTIGQHDDVSWVASKFTVVAHQVTPTSFRVSLYNASAHTVILPYTEWKVLVVGAE